MKKLLAITLSIILIVMVCPFGMFTFTASAEATYGFCGQELTWQYDTSTDTLTITGTGAMNDYSYSSYNGGNVTTAPWRSYYQDIKTIVIETGVTSIGSSAFEACSGLTSVTISNSVTSVGTRAFLSCTGLKSITIPNSVTSISLYAFLNCSGLESVIVESGNPIYHSAGNCIIETESKTLVAGLSVSKIPDDGSVTSIGRSSFEGCSNLTSITIPNSITSIGDYAFFNSSALRHVWYQGSEDEKNNKLTISGSGNTALENARWHYYVEGTQEFQSDFAGGSGTENDPYLISTAEHLDNVRCYLTSNFKMINNITISNFTPIGCDGNYLASDSFSGVFDGNGFSISGMTMSPKNSFNYYKTSYYFGLFYSVNGRVCNLHLENINLNAGDSWAYSYAHVGGIAAINDGVISNCTVSGTLHCSSDDELGGIVAYNRYGTVEQCANFASISGSGQMAGIVYDNNGNVKNCYNAGGIWKTASESYFSVYGIVGDGRGSVSCCYNTGQLYSYNALGTRGCSNTNLYCLSSSLAGRYYNYPGGTTLLSESEMQDQNSFVGFDFENVWTMGGDPDYPYPELQCFALSGEVGVKGNVAYLSTAEVDLSKINKVDDTIRYIWLIDGRIASTEKNYSFSYSEIGKTLKVSVTGTKDFNKGTLYSQEIIITKAIQSEEPTVPELQSVDDNSFSISTVSTQEYSIDNINWQKSGTFQNLEPNKNYTVYSRILETSQYLLGESKAVLNVKTDRRPLSGSVSITGTSRYGDTLYADVSGVLPENATFDYEWKRNGQVTGTGTTYTVTENDIGNNITLSVKGTGNFIGTKTSSAVTATKTTVQMPNAPVVADKTNTTVTLESINGYEYSRNKTTWQDSPVFTNLSPATEYTFYQRAKETDTTFASKTSNGTKETTLKNGVSAPSAPTVINITNISVTLKNIPGYEYSLDGLSWQKSNVFTDLSAYTEYSFCQRVAETDTAYSSAQSGYTIVMTLKNPVNAPLAPTVSAATDSSVTLSPIAGYEYSSDGETWQKSNVFAGLTVLQTYTFYQRIAETDFDFASPASPGLSFKVKNLGVKADIPVLVEKTNNKITVEAKSDCLFSIDGINWSEQNIFTGLYPNTTYYVYCRNVETDTSYAGEESDPLIVTTLKNTVDKPAAPTVDTKTFDTVTLVAIPGYEYSLGGQVWQESNVFADLSPNTEYSFYQRISESDTDYVSSSSDPITVTTLKTTVAKPDAPVIDSKTSDTVTLGANAGYEYSIDGSMWQTSNVFEGLEPNKEYNFYQRVAETYTSYASEVSEGTTVTTLKKSSYKANKPVAVEIKSTAIKLQEITSYEYSKDGVNWQQSPVFTGLTPDTNYTFYQRIAETNTHYAGDKSEALTVKTLPKPECLNSAVKPVVASIDSGIIALVEREGYEYRLSTGTWRSTPVFTGLTVGQSYVFYQRIKETEAYKASAESEGLTVTITASGQSTRGGYQKLYDYIEQNGYSVSGGKKVTIYTNSTSDTTVTITCKTTSSGIYCETEGVVQSGNTKFVSTTGFYITSTGRYISVSHTSKLIVGSSLVTSETASGSFDRSTYVSDKTVATSGSSDSTKSVLNSDVSLTCSALNAYLYQHLRLKLVNIGFLAYNGGSSSICDEATNRHVGSSVLKYSYPATCEQNGYTGDYCCSKCGTIITRGQVIPSLGGHQFDNACDNDCNVCGFKREVEHSYTDSCDDTCNICGAVREAFHIYDSDCDEICNNCGQERVAPHVVNEWTQTKAPTCTEKGSETATCSACGEVITRDIPALGHNIIHHDAKKPTCTEKGWSAYDTCSRCEYSTYHELDPLGHDYKAVVTKPTCTERGYTTYTCSRCHDSYVDNYTDALGHNYSETWSKNNNQHWHECSVCHDKKDLANHTFVNGKCSVCGYIAEKVKFPDVSYSAWYGDSVAYAVSSGLMKGYANGKFGTADGIQRQDFVVILARLSGDDIDSYAGKSSFKDVPTNAYYATALAWAKAKGVSNGYQDGSFGVGDKVTREQIMTFLYNYAKLKGYDTTVTDAEKAQIRAQYSDFVRVSSYAQEATYWALKNGVISGKQINGKRYISPGSPAQRCEVAAMFYNINEKGIFA